MPADLEAGQAGILDTNILIHWERLPARLLPDVGAVTAITFAELAERVDKLQRVESAFEPIPFDGDAARAYGRVTAAVRAAGRSPRARVADQMIAAIAVSRALPLYTTNPDDFAGLEGLLRVVAVPRPAAH